MQLLIILNNKKNIIFKNILPCFKKIKLIETYNSTHIINKQTQISFIFYKIYIKYDKIIAIINE